MSSTIDIADNWKELQGICDKWKKLLEAPELCSDLRQSILVYGNLVGAAVDSLEPNTDTAKYPLDCRYNKNSLFPMVGLEIANPYKYEVTKYIYTTANKANDGEPPDLSSRYGAFVAVATDKGALVLGRRDIVVAWTGTVTEGEGSEDQHTKLVDANEVLGQKVVGKVHQGFLSVYKTANENSPFEDKTSARDQVCTEVKKLVDFYERKGEVISITVTGYSLGSAVATLNSIDIVANQYNVPSYNSAKQIPVTVIAFGSPKVGDSDFANGYDNAGREGNLNLLRVNVLLDPAPILPLLPDYKHCGVETVINVANSPFLNLNALTKLHELELYCHGVAGSHNSDEIGFCLEVDRPVALLNKHLDVIKDSYNVPKNWWVETKGMIQLADGTWKPTCPS